MFGIRSWTLCGCIFATMLVEGCGSDPIVGCWVWDGGSTVVVTDDGREANSVGDVGTWTKQGGDEYHFVWNSGYENDVTVEGDSLHVTTPVTPKGAAAHTFDATTQDCGTVQ